MKSKQKYSHDCTLIRRVFLRRIYIDCILPYLAWEREHMPKRLVCKED